MKLGDVVRLKNTVVLHSYMDLPENSIQAKIVCMLEDIPGGVFLDEHLAGFRYWNVEELEVVEADKESA